MGPGETRRTLLQWLAAGGASVILNPKSADSQPPPTNPELTLQDRLVENIGEEIAPQRLYTLVEELLPHELGAMQGTKESDSFPASFPGLVPFGHWLESDGVMKPYITVELQFSGPVINGQPSSRVAYVRVNSNGQNLGTHYPKTVVLPKSRAYSENPNLEYINPVSVGVGRWEIKDPLFNVYDRRAVPVDVEIHRLKQRSQSDPIPLIYKSGGAIFPPVNFYSDRDTSDIDLEVMIGLSGLDDWTQMPDVFLIPYLSSGLTAVNPFNVVLGDIDKDGKRHENTTIVQAKISRDVYKTLASKSAIIRIEGTGGTYERLVQLPQIEKLPGCF